MGVPGSGDRREADPFFQALGASFDQALRPWKSGTGPVALLFSGGLDSTLLAWELRERSDLRLVTVGFEGSSDLLAAGSAAESLGLAWGASLLEPSDLETAASRIAPELDGVSGVMRSVLMAVAVGLERAPASTVLCGQGADELFLGYAHFGRLSIREASVRSESDLTRLMTEDWPRTERIAERLSRTIVAPYLEREFVDTARRIPISLRLPDPVPKAFLRAFAIHRGLPPALAERPKRAIQYGSGVDRALRRRA